MTRTPLSSPRTQRAQLDDPTAGVSLAGPKPLVVSGSAASKVEQVHRLLVSIADARAISGLSRSEIYRRMAVGDIRALKSGSRTLIVLRSLIKHLNSLPPATFHVPR